MHMVKTLLVTIAFALTATAPLNQALAETVTTQAADGIVVYGETYYGALDDDAPVVALFHLAGGDGRGEYAPLSGWLNKIGLRAIAWDLRSGGDRFGSENRTAAAFAEDVGYCEAYPDMAAAFQHSAEIAARAPVVIWGSSYSAALVFTLAAENPADVAALVAASPASGEPMAQCSLDSVLHEVKAPILALRPRREIDVTKAQMEMLIAAGITFHIVEHGVHGSSMLNDDRTKHDMTADREFVASWLSDILDIKED